MSRELDRNKAFYQAVFGYEYSDIESTGFRYATLKVGGRDVAGIGELDSSFPAEVPAHWMVYFLVTDTDTTVATAERGRRERDAAALGYPVRADGRRHR